MGEQNCTSRPKKENRASCRTRGQNNDIGMVIDCRNTLNDKWPEVDRQRGPMLQIKDRSLEKDYKKVCGMKPKWDR